MCWTSVHEDLREIARDCLNQDVLDSLDFQDGGCLAWAGADASVGRECMRVYERLREII